MKSILREQRRSSIVAAAVTILLGLMLVLVPNRSIRFLCGLLGLSLIHIFADGLALLLGELRLEIPRDDMTDHRTFLLLA